jgi:hypothetical protein
VIELDGPLSIVGNQTTVDFTSQTIFTGDTNPNGNEVGLAYYGPPSNAAYLYVYASDCTIRGLDLTTGNAFGGAINIRGHRNTVERCTTDVVKVEADFGGPPITGNIIRNNTLSTVEILCWADDNIVVGNRLTHVRVEGSQYCVYPMRNRIGGPSPEERNTISGYGRYGEEGLPTGSQVDVVWAQDTVVEGNYIGTTPDGMARQPQIGPGGITVRDAIGTVIRGNLIAGLRTVGGGHYQGVLFGDAIAVGGTNSSASGTIIQGNTIGLAADGVTIIPTLRGVTVASATALRRAPQTTIGGTGPGQGNTFRGLETFGVFVASLETGVRISGNTFAGCGRNPIELIPSSGSDGPTPNDPGDADSGSNDLMNYPVVVSVEVVPGGALIRGTLATIANAAFSVELFASPACDPSGFGQAHRFLGAAPVTTSAQGMGAFEVLVPAQAGEVITATATLLTTGSTSELSACTPVAAPPCPADFNQDGGVDGQDVEAFFLAWQDADPSADVNSDGGVDGGDAETFFVAWEAGGC